MVQLETAQSHIQNFHLNIQVRKGRAIRRLPFGK